MLVTMRVAPLLLLGCCDDTDATIGLATGLPPRNTLRRACIVRRLVWK